MQLHAISALLFFTAVINLGEAYECYVCWDGSSCADPFDPDKLTAAQKCETDIGCVKAKSKTMVFRACATEVHTAKCETKDDKTGCICKSDLCNSASYQQATVSSVVSLLVCAVLAARRM